MSSNIPGLSAVTAPLDGTELTNVVQGGADKKATVQQLVDVIANEGVADIIITSGAASVIIFPTSDPMVVGAWWNNSGVLTISAAT